MGAIISAFDFPYEFGQIAASVPAFYAAAYFGAANSFLKGMLPPTHAQPAPSAKIDWKINATKVAGHDVPVETLERRISLFSTVWSFYREGLEDSDGDVLVVAPNSGHDPTIVRDMVRGLLPAHNVHVFGCNDPRWVAASHGEYGLDVNTRDVIKTMTLPDMNIRNIIGISQSGVVATVALAYMTQNAEQYNNRIPDALFVLGSPIDTRVNPNAMCWMAKHTQDPHYVFETVGNQYPGRGRRILSGQTQQTLLSYTAERKVLGIDPFGLQDLSARGVQDILDRVYRRHLLPLGSWMFGGQAIDISQIKSAVIAVTARQDMVCPSGQTSALLCLTPKASIRKDIQVEGGHYGLLAGECLQHEVLPQILRIMAARQPLRQLNH